MKVKALKEQTSASRPTKALTVYPPNTPATLVPRVLPTKSQVKINIFALIQLFSDFEKTCTKRITPTGLTKGERGFEQTKACYLTEVIPFFKTLKEHFEGIQKALTKEVKEMKEIFEELEAGVDQHIVDRKHDEIERKNLLIANDNLIADCLFKDVFHVATNSELNVSSFTKIHDAHTSLKARCLKLEVELSNLCDKIQKDNHDELTKQFSNLENKLSRVNKDQVKPKVLAPGKYAIDVEPIPPRNRNNREVHLVYLKHLKESVETLHEIVEEAKTERPLDRSIASACRVNSYTDASRSQPRSNTKKNRILSTKSVNMKKVEEHPKTIKCSLNTTNRVDSSISSKRTVINLNSHSVCQTCNKCLISANRDMCVVTYLHSVNATPSVKNDVHKVKQVWKPKQVKQVWKPTGNILTTVGRTDRPLVFGLRLFKTYDRGSLAAQEFRKKVHRDGLGHNLFSVGQFCDSDLEVAFRKHSCYVRDTDSVELIKGSCGSNLYTISIDDMLKSSPICLLSKASKNKSWLWHRRLNHLNFGKSKKHTHKPKTKNTNLEVLNTLHMDLCGTMRVQTIIGKKYILVIIDDYSRFTWVKFLRSKDETPEVVIKFLKQIQFGLNKTVRNICTDNGIEFVNKDLTDYYERVGIFYQKTVPRTLQQNGVVERQNRTLVEAARTMLIFSKALMFLWAKVVATACYTQNRSLIHTRRYKTPYKLVHDKKPDLTFFRVFGALCYPTNDSKDLGKL
ncbi:retrovirus-related pol polyprotein from transposon TNT 1-94 [Tanacetum coccineum]